MKYIAKKSEKKVKENERPSIHSWRWYVHPNVYTITNEADRMKIISSKISKCEILSSELRNEESNNVVFEFIKKVDIINPGLYRHWAFRFTLTDDSGKNYYLYSDFTVNNGISVYFTD
jgi:hypothetical protein